MSAESGSGPGDPTRRGALGDRYRRDGYAVVPGLFGVADVARVRDEIDALFAEVDGLPPGHIYDLGQRPGGIPALRNVLQLRPGLRSLPGLGAALELAAELLGGGAEILWDAAVYKPVGSLVETPWHQDEAVFAMQGLRMPRSLIYFWVALDAVDEGCAPIRFVPGTHLGPVLPHSWHDGDAKTSLILDGPLPDRPAIAVPLAAGDATIHHPRTLHGAGGNRTERCRKAWVLGIGRPSAPRWLRRLKQRLRSGMPPA